MRQLTEMFVAEVGSVTAYVAGEPAVTVAVIVVNVGAPEPDPAVSTSKNMVFEAPPPGEGDCTVTLVTPAEATSEAGTEPVSCVALTSCVVRAVAPT